MKILMTAIAFVIAAPAAAQTAPPPQQHQGHDQHQQHQPAPAQPGQPPNAQHSQHQGAAAERDCCADRNGNGRMDCCERMAEAGDRRGCCCEEHPAQPSAPSQAHQDH